MTKLENTEYWMNKEAAYKKCQDTFKAYKAAVSKYEETSAPIGSTEEGNLFVDMYEKKHNLMFAIIDFTEHKISRDKVLKFIENNMKSLEAILLWEEK